MGRTLRLSIALALLSLLIGPWQGVPPAAAESGAVLEVGTSTGCTYTTIEAAIAAANPGDTIKVENIVYDEGPLTIDKDLTLAGGYNTAPDPACLTITGTGHTTLRRTGTASDRILTIDGATVTVTWFIFEDNANGGGLSVVNGDLALEEVTLRNNHGSDGGGLEVYQSTARLTDVEFNDNSATYGGGLHVGGPSLASTVALTHTTFRRNEATNDGGAIYIKEGSRVSTHDWVAIGIDGPTINRAGRDGGGVAIVESSYLTVTAGPTLSYLSYNYAGQHGGGVYADHATLTFDGLIDPTFDERLMLGNNMADEDGDGVGDGGGIYAANGTLIQANESFLFGNAARNGGGIYLRDSRLLAEDVRIHYNEVDLDGGGVYVTEGSAFIATAGSELGGWSMPHYNSAGGDGGGLYVTNDSFALIDNAVVRGNRVGGGDGAGVYVAGGALFGAVNDATIERNDVLTGTYGGGLYVTGTDTRAHIIDSTIMTNTSYHGGGGYVTGGARVTLENARVQANVATTNGGGFRVDGLGTRLELTNTLVYSNSASYGGGIYSQNGDVVLREQSALFQNAAEWGGGVYQLHGTLDARDATFYLNRATDYLGGGLRIYDATAALERILFLENYALNSNGGALAINRGDVHLRRSVLQSNGADGEGSAIHVMGLGCVTPASIANNFILHNDPLDAGSGSSLYVTGNCAEVTHNTFARDTEDSIAVYAADGSILTLTNNILSNFGTGIRRPVAGTGVVTATHTLYHSNLVDYDAAVVNVNALYGDPAFVSPPYDYHIRRHSVALDAGAAVPLSEDFDGDGRPMNGGYDVGADEYPAEIYLPLVLRGT